MDRRSGMALLVVGVLAMTLSPTPGECRLSPSRKLRTTGLGGGKISGGVSRVDARSILTKASSLLGQDLAQWETALGLPQGPQVWSAGDSWCGGLRDGMHADTLAHPPCSGYFECRQGKLTGLHPCPRGLEFSTLLAKCVGPERSSCASAQPGNRRSDLVVAASSSGRGVDYQVDLTALNQTNALLLFKANVLDFQGALATWLPRRNLSDSVSSKMPGQCGLGLPCSGRLPCWQHITCSDTGDVTAVQIEAKGLGSPMGSTSIPPQFSLLTGLQKLVLKGSVEQPMQGLTGGVPTELSALTSLTLLDLSYNHLSGSLGDSGIPLIPSLREVNLKANWFSEAVPSSFSALRGLAKLDLSQNALTGSIPGELGVLRNLTLLDLSLNKLSGSIPAGLGAAASLGTLNLARNQLQGIMPDSLTKLTALTELYLNKNNLTGTVPPGFAAMTGLMTLELSGNKFGGNLPLRSVCQTGLFALSLADNNFTGTLSAADFRGCGAGIAKLNVSNNALSGPLPSDFFTMISNAYFDTFSASKNGFTGSIPQSLATLKGFVSGGGIGTLELANNRLSGSIPTRVACFSGLFLQGNQLSGPVPPSLLNCASLSFLDLSDNVLTGPLAATVAAAPLFKPAVVNITGNKFTGPVPVPRGAACSNLTEFYASSNAFSGPMPDASGCRALASLDLSNSGITGGLNASLLPLRGGVLGALNLSGNALTGTPDASLAALKSLQSLDLSNNQLQGGVPSVWSSLQLLTWMDLKGNEFTRTVPAGLGNMTKLHHLDLSRNSLVGEIPRTLAPPGMVGLTFLDLSHNNLNGSIPFGFANVSKSVTLNFSSNELCGKVPPGVLSSPAFDASVFANNTCLCEASGLAACPPPASTGSPISVGALVCIILGSILFLGCNLAALWCALFYRRRQSIWEGGTMLTFEKSDVPVTIQQILSSTENFDEKHMLGRGGFGSVYKGLLADGRTVAIKRLAAGSGQGQKEFQAEMQILGNIRHRNLVVLVAAYVTRPPSNEKLLIYEFLPGGSMDRMLTKELPKDSSFKRWPVRRKVIEDVARGLKYLHHDCTPRIVHRDMKPANVLLDEKAHAKVADFGLAREFDVTKSHVSTSVFGTIGYLAPEYTTRGRLSFKSDVFAFGVMVLQVVTGKQPTDADVAERGLARWVGGASTLSVCDPRIEDAEKHLDEIMGVITLGLRCTARVPSDRPSMEEVVYSLDHLHDFAMGFGKGNPNGKGKEF